ncbi:gephyrin-like molybdotransferase Glp [Fimbriimonas ginsengisoli]|uniref:Molybdopterin molybdenumtransferase n=1 Tax=Fimbriimonas ginsengisoli Gsoil 348 TaxID=661478 RepID=A0A068NVU5_FIMGI|nr:gephyrin-like molybdotransferase Glp [Fimbriimonas ginsengisoli]AIE85729.1 Molybdopterin biosynthesis protein MoeA [Fimbriimonas ginsengisoli Gsoil 348]
MLTYEEALSTILDAVAPLQSESESLVMLPGRILAEPIVAPIDLPVFDNSAVDGYGVGLPIKGPLRLKGELAAGSDPTNVSVGKGETIRIFTGAPVPAGVNAVAMQEDCVVENGSVTIGGKLKVGEHVRRRGDELTAGTRIFDSGVLVTPPVLGVLAMCGVASASVARRPRITVVETGTELVEPGQPLTPGAVYAANGVALAAAAQALGAETRILRATDDPALLKETLRDAMNDADLVVTSGGVSVGDHDLVRPTWESLGVREVFWRVSIKPGKPVFFGKSESGPLVLGLPGNPVSSLVTFRLFVRPALLALQGRKDGGIFTVRAGVEMRGSDSRDEFVRVNLRDGHAYPTPHQGSNEATGLATADALVRLPAGTVRLKSGEKASALLLDWAP